MTPDKELKSTIKDTLEWASELSALWSNTTVGNVIDSQKEHLEHLIRKDEMYLASVQVLELAQTCDYAAKVQNGH